QPMSRAGPACSEQFSWLRVRANQVGASVKKNPANEHLHKQFSATNRLKIGETVADSLKIGEAEKISKVISPSSKKKGVP
ncbi:hypothetical protein ABVB18_20570, partial [Xanthomonas citri pv. mangiferaeindicae]